MLDATPTAAPGPTPASTQPLDKGVDKGTYFIQKKSFTGEKKGFSFHIVQWKNETEEEATASIEAMKAKWGADSVVTLVNTAIASSLRTKANNALDIVQNDDSHNTRTEQGWQRLLEAGKDVLLTEADAESYIPGEREKSIAGMMKEANDFMKQAEKCTDPAEKMKLFAQASEKIKNVQALIEEKSILESAGDNTAAE